MVAPRCAACSSTLSGAPLLPRGGQVVVFGGEMPFLYNGVVCQACSRVECAHCQHRRGQGGDTPCRWCGGKVSPAFAHLVGVGAARQPGTVPPRPPKPRPFRPRRIDFLTGPFRLLAVAFFLGVAVVLLGVLPVLGVCAWLMPDPPLGPLTGEGTSIYWIASPFGKRASVFIYYASWAVGLLGLAAFARWAEPLWGMLDRSLKEGDDSFHPSGLEIRVQQVLAVAAAVALLPLPLLTLFSAASRQPPWVVCALDSEGLTLRGEEIKPKEPPGEGSGGQGGAVAVKNTSGGPAGPGGKPPPVAPERIREGNVGGPVEKVVAWKDIRALWFTPFKDGRVVLNWADLAGRKDWVALPAHVRFTAEDQSGWRDAVERFAPRVLLLDEKEHAVRTPVLDPARFLAELDEHDRQQDYGWAVMFSGGLLTLAGEVRQVAEHKVTDPVGGKHRREVVVSLAVGPEKDSLVIYCFFGGEVIAGMSDEERNRLDALSRLEVGRKVVVRGRWRNDSSILSSPYQQKKPGRNIHLHQCERLPDPATGGG